MFGSRSRHWILATLSVTLFHAGNATAHFIWIKSDVKNGKVALRSGFGDPDRWELESPEKIDETSYFLRHADGTEKPISASLVEETGEWVAETGAAAPVMMMGVLEYGVFGGGGGKPFLLRYFAKHLKGAPGDWEKVQGSPRLSIEAVARPEGKDMRITVLVGGRPLPDAELKLYGPNASKAKSAKTGADGTFLWSGEGPGEYALYTNHKLPGGGTHEGKAYEGIREYATLTFTLAGESNSPSAPK